MRHVLPVLLAVLLFLSCVPPNGNAIPATEHAWYPTLQDALDAAASAGKLTLMLAGRDTCGNCTYMKGTVCESESVKPVLLEHYVTAYVDIDNSTDWYPYSPDGGFILPLIAIIDPANPNVAISTTTSVRYEEDFLADIQAPLQ
jgi:hypothetical protein